MTETTNNHSTSRFYLYLLLVAICAGGLVYIYNTNIVDSDRHQDYAEWLTKTSETFANSVYSIDNTLIKGEYGIGQTLLTTRDGAEVFVGNADGFLYAVCLLSAIIFWPSNILKKLIGISVAVCAILFFDVLRVASSLFMDVHWPLSFDSSKTYFAIIHIALIVLIFVIWTIFSKRHPMTDPLHKIW